MIFKAATKGDGDPLPHNCARGGFHGLLCLWKNRDSLAMTHDIVAAAFKSISIRTTQGLTVVKGVNIRPNQDLVVT